MNESTKLYNEIIEMLNKMIDDNVANTNYSNNREMSRANGAFLAMLDVRRAIQKIYYSSDYK